jgi:hypothetical protein
MLLDGKTLRQQEKIYGFIRLIINSFTTKQFIFPDLLFVLVYIKMIMPELYNRIRTHNLSVQELGNEFENLIPEKLYRDRSAHGLLFLEARLLTYYRNDRDFNRRQEPLYEKNNETTEKTTHLQTKLKSDDADLADALYEIGYRERIGHTKLSFLLDRIDLLNNTL